jgi:chorismate synthase
MFDPVNVSRDLFDALRTVALPVLDQNRGREMLEAIEDARYEGDSLGGVIECAAVGVPGGLGDPIFDGMENRIAALVFGIPAVKGIEFGSGFTGASLRGSENNDGFLMAADGSVRTCSNNHGGILGGITSGMPIVFRAAVKPTPSIAKEQQSVSLSGKKNVELSVKGRHDPCIVPRAVPVIEAAAAISIYDAFLENNKYREGEQQWI